MFKGFLCPRNDQKLTPKYCLMECDNWCVPPILLKEALDWEDRGKEIHISSVAGNCLRQEYYKATRDWWAYPEDLYQLIRGSLLARIAESFKKLKLGKGEEHFVEQPVSYTFADAERGEITIKGRYDHFYPKRGLLIDYKTTSDWGLKYLCSTSKDSKFDKWSYVKQVNLYAYCLRKLGYMVLRQELETFTMTQGKTTKIEHIYTDEECEKLFQENGRILWDAFNKDLLPPAADDHNRQWLCSGRKKNYCVFCEPKFCDGKTCEGWKKMGEE